MDIKELENFGEGIALNNAPGFVMNTAAEALDLLGHYSMDFTDREQDPEDLASLLRIISFYLRTKAENFEK